MHDFSDIVEVVTCSKKRVNLYLEAGYRLIAVDTETVWTSTPKDVESVEGYVLKHFIFVVGRPEGVPHFDPERGTGGGHAT